MQDVNHYSIDTDIKRAGHYDSDVFDGDNFLGKIIFTTHGGVGKNNSDFS
jgi:hypothetical protein